jgi:hypothetical protein
MVSPFICFLFFFHKKRILTCNLTLNERGGSRRELLKTENIENVSILSCDLTLNERGGSKKETLKTENIENLNILPLWGILT